MKRLFCALFFSVLTISASAQTPSKGNNGKYGYMKNGNVVIPYIYDYASDFSEDLAIVCKSSKFGFIDRSGNIVIPCEYRNVNACGFSEGTCGVTKNGKKWFYIDKYGQRINGKDYLATMPFKSGMASVHIADNTAIFVNKAGEQVIDAQFAYAESFHNGIAVAGILDTSRTKLMYGFIDDTGRWISNSFYDKIYSEADKSPFDGNGFVMVRKGNRHGYINAQMQFFESIETAVAANTSIDRTENKTPVPHPVKETFDFECGKFYRITHSDFRSESNNNPDLLLKISIELAWVSFGNGYGCVMTWGDEEGADQIDVYSLTTRKVLDDGTVQYSNEDGEHIDIRKGKDCGVLLIQPKDKVFMIYRFDMTPLDEPFVKREFRQ